MEFNPPYYDRSLTYSITAFYDHSLQSIMAIFIAKSPKLGDELMSMSASDRQDFFFDRFHRFLNDYVHLSLDDGIYFSNTAKEKAGTQGGGTRAGSKYFKDRQKTEQSNQAAKIKYFEQKFKCCISGDKDERMFLGVSHIWNRVATEKDKLLAPYMGSIQAAYDDESFATPIPNKLDRYLVPLKIRNKVCQKWSNRRRAKVVPMSFDEEKEEAPNPASEWRIQPVEVDEDW